MRKQPNQSIYRHIKVYPYAYLKFFRPRFLLIMTFVVVLCVLYISRDSIYAGFDASDNYALHQQNADVDVVIEKVRGYVNEDKFEEALELLSPYVTNPVKYPTLYSDYLVILTWTGRAEEALRRFEALPAGFPRRAYLLNNMAKTYLGQGNSLKAHALYGEVLAQHPGDLTALEGIVSVLVARGDWNGVFKLLNAAEKADKPAFQIDLLRARVLLIQGDYIQTLDLYDAMMKNWPEEQENIRKIREMLVAGLSADYRYLYADQRKFIQTQDILNKKKDAAFAINKKEHERARWLEEVDRYWDAVRVYDRILENTPNDVLAKKFRLAALSKMGATSVAAGKSAKLFPADTALNDFIRRDAAVDHIHWDEPEQAIQYLSELVVKEGGERYLFDYVVALARDHQYNKSIELYEGAVASGYRAPYWATLTVADAHMMEQKPEQALSLYELILADQSNMGAANLGRFYALRAARMGKFYALQTLRRWQQADEYLEAMRSAEPETALIDGKIQPNPVLFQLDLAFAWYLAAQNRLSEAKAVFENLYDQTPANLDVRNGLAHIYLWRGWPRKSLKAFNIIGAMDADYTPSHTGRVMALNSLALKELARDLIAGMLKQRPRDKNLIEIERKLAVEQMRIWRTEIYGQREDNESYDTLVRTELSSPLSLKTRLFGYGLWRRTSYDANGAGDTAAYYKRVGVGLDHVINSDWRLLTSFSANYHDGKDAGAAMRVDCTPTDVWSFSLYGDTHATDVAMRARAAGIDAYLGGAEITWRQSEKRQAGIGYNHSVFSDDNIRDSVWIGYQQDLWAKHDWRMRIFTDLYASWNSKGDETVYFNPSRAWGVSVTHMTEHTVWRRYQRSFVHRFYATVGNYQQRGYRGDFVGSLRYEQAHDFSDRHAFQFGIGIGRNVYDGNYVNDINFNLVYQWRF
jgi:biofilm PGA synthesis protein PgaA